MKDSSITLGLLALAALQIAPVRADTIVVTLNSPISASPGDTVPFTVTVVPEPGSLGLLGAGVVGLLGAVVTIRGKSGLALRGAPR